MPIKKTKEQRETVSAACGMYNSVLGLGLFSHSIRSLTSKRKFHTKKEQLYVTAPLKSINNIELNELFKEKVE